MAYDELPIPGIEQMMRLIFRHEDDKLWSQQGEMDAWKYRLKVSEKLNKQNNSCTFFINIASFKARI